MMEHVKYWKKFSGSEQDIMRKNTGSKKAKKSKSRSVKISERQKPAPASADKEYPFFVEFVRSFMTLRGNEVARMSPEGTHKIITVNGYVLLPAEQYLTLINCVRQHVQGASPAVLNLINKGYSGASIPTNKIIKPGDVS
jgi:hypothetical protein